VSSGDGDWSAVSAVNSGGDDWSVMSAVGLGGGDWSAVSAVGLGGGDWSAVSACVLGGWWLKTTCAYLPFPKYLPGAGLSPAFCAFAVTATLMLPHRPRSRN
jgi:hypothetical protein